MLYACGIGIGEHWGVRMCSQLYVQDRLVKLGRGATLEQKITIKEWQALPYGRALTSTHNFKFDFHFHLYDLG